MNKYLLLRDNKQTGPYSVEELVKKGLKPYDLVWLDGRSAAWRYPSEIDELKAFAPVVEEQPYDRFYKRSSSTQEHAIHSAQQQLGKQEQSQPDIEHTSTPVFTAPIHMAVQGNTEQTITAVDAKEATGNIPVSRPQVKTGTGKVYVTLPAGFRQQQAVQKPQLVATEKPQPVQASGEAAMPEKATAVNHASGKQEEERVAEEAAKALEARTAALAESIQAAAAAASKKQTAEQAIQQWNQSSVHSRQATSSTEQSASFSSLINKDQQEEPVPVIPMRNQSGKKHLLLMRSIVAACLVLGGIVIGMALTYSKGGSGNQQALDQLVQRLQEREAQRQAGVQPEQTVGETSNPEHNAAYAEEIAPPDGEQSHIQDNQTEQQLAVKKDKKVPPVVNNEEAPVTFQEKDPQEMKVTQAVITRKDEPRPVREADIAAAREKIYQMVQVAASPFRTGVLGGISNLYFTVSNTSSFPLDRIELEVKYLGPENRVVKVQRLLFNDVGAGAQKTLEAPRTSRGVSIDYVVTKINSRALGMAHSGF